MSQGEALLGPLRLRSFLSALRSPQRSRRHTCTPEEETPIQLRHCPSRERSHVSGLMGASTCQNLVLQRHGDLVCPCVCMCVCVCVCVCVSVQTQPQPQLLAKYSSSSTKTMMTIHWSDMMSLVLTSTTASSQGEPLYVRPLREDSSAAGVVSSLYSLEQAVG
jgi:hypothetical protein